MEKPVFGSIRATVGFAVLSILLFAWLQAPIVAGQSTPKQTVIEGARNPERIPEWYRWDRLLSRAGEAALAQDMPNSQFVARTMFLVKDDLTELRRSGELHQQRKKAHLTRTQALVDAFDRTGKTPQQVKEELYLKAFALELDYRLEILAVRDRLYEKLTPDSLIAIDSWIREVVVKNTRVVLDPLDEQRFGQPR